MDKTILTYEIELPTSGKKVSFNLLNDEDFTIPYITDTIPNSPAGHQLPTQAKHNVWIIAINGEEHITSQGELGEINHHQNTHGKFKINISIWRSKSYQRIDLENIFSIFDQARPVVSHLEVRLPKKLPTPDNIGEGLKGPHIKLWKEALFVQYKNKNESLISASTPIKDLPEGTKPLRSLIATSIKEGDCSDAWKFVVRHCANGSYQIKDIDLYQSYIPVAHAKSSRINIAIADMHRLTASILYVSNSFQNTNIPINEIVFVSPPPYYLNCFERSYPNVPLNWDYGPVCLQFMNGIQETKPPGW